MDWIGWGIIAGVSAGRIFLVKDMPEKRANVFTLAVVLCGLAIVFSS